MIGSLIIPNTNIYFEISFILSFILIYCIIKSFNFLPSSKRSLNLKLLSEELGMIVDC